MSKIEDKLYTTRYRVDKFTHLKIADMDICRKCESKPCTIFCPAKVYIRDEDHIRVVYEGCLECGSCRIGCPYVNIVWNFPRGGFGVQHKFG